MKILSIGLDNRVLNKNSLTFKRQKEYADLVEEYHIVVFSSRDEENKHENLFVWGSGGDNKISQFFKAYKKARKILNNKHLADWLITVQDPFFAGFLGYLLRATFYIKLHVQIHGFEKNHGLRAILSRLVISKADGFRVVSQRLKKELMNSFGVDKDLITVVPIYTEKRKIVKKEAKKDKHKFVFLTVGRLVAVKNIELQIKAFIGVNQKYPNTELWIVGDGPEKIKLKDLKNNIEIPKNVRLFGWQDNLERFYNQADVFLLTSDYEGWGLVVIEAAKYSLPIIMTDVGCAGEVIKNRESGIVIAIKDGRALERAMIELIENKELREKLGKNANKAILKLPNKKETLELYKKSWQKTLKS